MSLKKTWQRVVFTAVFLLFNLAPSLTASAGTNAWTDIGLHGGAYYAIAAKPGSPGTLYAGAGGLGVLKTTDGGKTWNFTNAGLPQNSSMSYPFVSAIAIDPTAPSTVYLGTIRGVFKSTTDPEAWSAYNVGLTNLNISYNDLVIDPSNPATLYAGTQGGVFKSTNGGTTWEPAITGLTNLSISTLAVDPVNSLNVYAGTIGGGIFTTSDGGAHWISANNTALAGTHVYVIAIDPHTPATVYAGTFGHGLFKSTNHGGDWNLITSPGATVTGLVIIPEVPSTIYYGEGFSGVHKSTDGGSTWNNFNYGLTDPLVDTLALSPSNPHLLYAGTENTIFAADLPGSIPGSWIPAGSMPDARQLHAATLLPDGRVLVTGGATGCCGPLNSAALYNPASNDWTPAASMAAARQSHSALALTDGRVLVVGGYSQGSGLASAELYDPAGDTWSPAGSMAQGRFDQMTTLLKDGRVLAVGGCNNDLCSPQLNSAELYDPQTNTWSPAAAMAAARIGHTATLLADGRVLVAGGCCDTYGYPLRSAELYDPGTNTWSATKFEMMDGRAFHTATTLLNGRVLIAGGGTSFYGMDSAEIYVPEADAWAQAGNMDVLRTGHTAALLPSGDVLVVGGSNLGSATASAELYNPYTNTWSPTGSLSTPRRMHAATLLKNSKVLVTGGANGGSPFDSAELFSLATEYTHQLYLPAVQR